MAPRRGREGLIDALLEKRLNQAVELANESLRDPDTAELVTDDDGWTLRSATGCRTAHSEHTVAITHDGAEVLTATGRQRA